MTLRAPFWEAGQRKLVREQVRLTRYLKTCPTAPDTADELLDLWDIANREEPLGFENAVTHFRTEEDPIPFSHTAKYTDDGLLLPGYETASPEEIPEAVDHLHKHSHNRRISLILRNFPQL